MSILVVFLMLTATAAWSGRIFGLHIAGAESRPEATATAGPTLPTPQELTELGLAGYELLPLDSVSWQVRREKADADAGVLLTSAPLSGNVTGYAGATPLYIYVDDSGTICAVVASANEETPGYFDSAKEGMFAQWVGRKVADVQGRKADIVSGATYSSNSLAANMQAALAAYTARNAGADDTAAPDALTVGLVAGMLLLGLVAALRFRGNSRVRVVILVLNVGMLGFWCGQFLSFNLLHSWAIGGVKWQVGLPALLILGVAVAMSLLGHKKYYCTWVCPYGSLQELAWRLPLPKVHVSPSAYRWMSRLRFGVLMLLLLLLWSGFGFGLLAYEPFSAFLLLNAAPAVIVLAAVFVVAGIFIPRPWCRMACPLGTLLDLMEQDK